MSDNGSTFKIIVKPVKYIFYRCKILAGQNRFITTAVYLNVVVWKRIWSHVCTANSQMSIGRSENWTVFYFLCSPRIIGNARTGKTLIELHKCTSWFETFLFGHVVRYIFMRRYSFYSRIIMVLYVCQVCLKCLD